MCLTSCIAPLIGKAPKFTLLAVLLEWAKNRVGRIARAATLVQFASIKFKAVERKEKFKLWTKTESTSDFLFYLFITAFI